MQSQRDTRTTNVVKSLKSLSLNKVNSIKAELRSINSDITQAETKLKKLKERRSHLENNLKINTANSKVISDISFIQNFSKNNGNSFERKGF